MADKKAFIEALAPHALALSAETGIAPELIISQAALETGWGRSVAGNNYFGVKSHGKSGGQSVNTHEYVNGQRVNVSDNFRRYSGVEDSMRDYANFLQENPRYGKVLAAETLDDQIREMGRSGYATDPKYGSKLSSISKDVSSVLGSPRAAQRVATVAPTPRATIQRQQPRQPKPSVFGILGGKAAQGMIGVGQQMGASFNRQINNPGFKTRVAMNAMFAPRPQQRTPAPRPATPAQALSQPQSSRGVVAPGGDKVLQALFTRDVGDTNKHFADAVGRSQQQINTYRENKRNGLI